MAAFPKILALLLALCLLCGCSQEQALQTVVCQELTISLPAEFSDWSGESAQQGLAFNFAGETMGVCGVYEGKAALQPYLSQETALAYAQLFVSSNDLDASVEVVDGIPRFSYVSSDGTPLQYLCGVFVSQEHYWVVQAYCAPAQFDAHADTMWQAIASVTVS